MSIMKKNIYIGIGILLSLIVLFVGWISLQIHGDKVLKNTYINEVNLGGLNKKQAKAKLEKSYKLENIEVKYLNEKWNIDSKEIDLSYDIDKTLEQAYNQNRDASFIDNVNKTIKANFGKKNNIKIDINYDEKKLKKVIDNISKEINVEVKDAKLKVNSSSIDVVEGNSGLSVNTQESINNIIRELQKGNKQEELVVTKIEPNIKKEQLEEVDTLLGSYSTTFNSSVSGRSSNINIAASKTSDILLMPDEVFSYNDHTGMRTVANGYKNAPVIVQGVVQEGIGGGVCQVSSTLYNSVLYAGLEIVNLKNHSIPSTYVPKGRDATVTDGGIDFVFKNNLKYPVYFKNYVSGNVVTCQIYGSSKDKQKIQISTSIDGVSVAPIKKIDDPTIPKGEEKNLEASRNGYTVSTYRLYIDNNGNVVKKEKVATSYYPKKQGVIAVGTMEPKKEEPKKDPQIPPIVTETPNKPEEPNNPDTPDKPEKPEVVPEVPPQKPEPLPDTPNKPQDTAPKV